MKWIALLLVAGPVLAGQELLLVLDAPAGVPDHLSRFRKIDALRISGSSEFSVPGLNMLRARLPVSTFTVFDLREESHGFAGGLPVSWEANHNWANVGRSAAAVRADEERRLAALANRPVHAARLDAKYQRTIPRPVTLAPGPALTEEQLVTGAGLDYVRITVTDHTHPNDADVDRFVALALPRLKDGWMHFHCKAGVGRTTTFMVMAEMLRNAGREPAETIIRRQSDLAGYDLHRIHQAGWAAGTSRARRDFLYAFHAYCRAASPSFELKWSEWARARRASTPQSTSGQTTSTTAR